MNKEIEGFIKLNESLTLDIIIRIAEDANITENDIEYIKPIIENKGKEDERYLSAWSMFITSICDYVRIPVDKVIKTIEVRSRVFEAGLPGVVVELGNCIKEEVME